MEDLSNTLMNKNLLNNIFFSVGEQNAFQNHKEYSLINNKIISQGCVDHRTNKPQ